MLLVQAGCLMIYGRLHHDGRTDQVYLSIHIREENDDQL